MRSPTSRKPFGHLAIAIGLSGLLATTGCFHGRYYRGHLHSHGSGALALIGAAIVTAAIVSAIAPPPPRVVVVPAPRPGYSWQPGYWTRQDDEWVWVDGRWVELPANHQWSPTHWEQAPDGTWQLIPGRWVEAPPR